MVAAANLALEERNEVVDDKEDINRNQGGGCCLGKSSREGENKNLGKVAVDKRKMTTSGGEDAKNVQVKKKEERTSEGREEDIERVLEAQRGLFRGYLRSSW